eukprot:SAG31_NODE_8316_length_1475_cov_1.656977_2_plen_90_part_00
MDLAELAIKMESIAQYDPTSDGASRSKPRALGSNKMQQGGASAEQQGEDECRKGMIQMAATLRLGLEVRGYFLVFVPTIREIRDFYREM